METRRRFSLTREVFAGMKESEREEEKNIVGVKMKFYYELKHKYMVKDIYGLHHTVGEDSRKNGERKTKRKRTWKKFLRFPSLGVRVVLCWLKNKSKTPISGLM